MGGKTAKLSDIAIRTAKPAKALRKLSDGRGLQLWVTPEGGKYWRLEYRFAGKRKLLALGIYPEVSAKSARDEAEKARTLLRSGADPSVARRQAKAKTVLEAENSFEKVANWLLAKKRKEGLSAATIVKNEWIIAKLRSALGALPMTTIGTTDIIKVLSKEADAGNLETAKRVRTFIGEVFRFAAQHGLVAHDPVAATKGAIAVAKAKHHSAILEPKEFGDLLRRIDDYATRSTLTGAALKLLALLYPRPGELRAAEWKEFDLQDGTWEIPASRMKLRQAHVKALPNQAVNVLKALHSTSAGTGYVFPATGRPGRCMSENTFNAALKRMGVKPGVHTPHGFRATASTLLNAGNLFSPDAIERSLAHQDKDAVRRAYARGDVMTERRKMAQWWADYLDRLKSSEKPAANVVSFGR